MKHTRAALIWTVAVTISMLTSAVPAAAATPGNAPGVRYQDYLRSAGSFESASAAGIGADQCTLPLSSRTGKWYCTTATPGDIRNSFLATADSVDATGFCNSSGCYNRIDDFRADFQSNSGTYGYNGTVLGTEQHYVLWTLSGRQNVSKPVTYRNSRATTSVVFSGDLINAAPGAVGSPVGGAYSIFNAGDVPADTTRGWTPNGYKTYDGNNFDHVQVHQFSWSVAGYPGYWYSYVASINSTSADKAIYRFRSVNALPANPYGGGYRS